MKYLIKKFIFGFSILLVNIIPTFIFSYGDVKVSLPDGTWQVDVNVDNTQVNTKESTIFEYIQIINYYLWFSIAGISMAVLVYAGIQMITAGGDKAKVSKGGKLALSCLIAILISMLSYTLVNLIINLF